MMEKTMPQIEVPMCPSDLLNNDAAAAYIGVSPKTLPVWRSTQRYDLPFIKIGRLVRYRRSDLDEWLERQTRRSEPQP